MKKVFIVFFLWLTLIPYKAFTQTPGTCDCFITDTLTFSEVPFTLGADSVKPPYYYNNVNTSQAIKLPFRFCFYGTDYDTVYIGNKGNITFVKPVTNFKKGNFPAGHDTMMIAPFWADINNFRYGICPPGMGEVWYKIYPTYMVVGWYRATFYTFDHDYYNTFQLIISDGTAPIIPGGNNVEFCYETLANAGMQWASADSSGGILGFNGIPATVGVNKGNNIAYAVISRFKLPGLTYYGPDSLNNGLYWLDGKSFILNTCVHEKNIPPVIINPDVCDTINTCRYDSVVYDVSFLCSEQGQNATLTASAPTLAGIVTNTTSSPNGIYNIHLTAYTGDSALGYHTINVTATDNSSPPQISTFPIVVNVNICDGVNELKINNEKLKIFPNPNNGVFSIQANSPVRMAGPGGQQLIANSYVEVYNLLGERIYSQTLNIKNSVFNIDMGNNANGIYFYRVVTETGSLAGEGKFVIQK